MNISLESSETSTLQLLNQKAKEVNAMINSYNSMLATKYELPATRKFSISLDFTTIVEVEVPVVAPVDAATTDTPSVSSESK